MILLSAVIRRCSEVWKAAVVQARKIAQCWPGNCFLPGPMKHNAGCDQQIVLVVVRGVRESSQIIIDLNNSQREPGTQRYINTSANPASKLVGSIAYSSHSAAGMRGAQQHLCKGLWLMFPFEPWLRKSVTDSGQIRYQRQ